jgi:4-amino-4-deoxy-L-arabinose transferase-like glycosyltransferase
MSYITSHRWLLLSMLLLWCGLLFFYGMTAGELYRTESLRAMIAQESLRSGNWVVPTLYGQPLLTKPPGMYAAIALVSWPFGEVTQCSARLPSAIAATLTVLLFYWYFARLLGRPFGFVAAMILPASLFWLDKAPSAEIDMLQVAWVTASLLFFLCAIEEPPTAPSRLSSVFCLLSLLCVAGGFLTKWTAPAFYYATILPFLWWRGQLRWLIQRDHLLGVGLASMVCGGWLFAAGSQVGWETLWTSVSREALQHLSPAHRHETVMQMGESHRHGANYWAESLLFPWKMLALALPWSLLIPFTMRSGFVRQLDDRSRMLWQAMHCWLWPNLLIWTFLPDPSSRHAAPILPAVVGLSALWFKYAVSEKGSQLHLGFASPQMIFASVVLWIGVKLAFVHGVMPARAAERQPRSKGEQIAACVPAGTPLYLFRLKDEGIMFYTSRIVRRLDGPDQLPSSGELVYCMLMESEWDGWPPTCRAEPLLRLHDEQGAPILLVKVQH